ncbi:helix-turn-helix transcriptional regulator [Eggerthella sinensis]|uniref:helix-turn-helix transcriptional regulator n=1 Tax=Eggerthella sinensis TaxID=242230 RepID=UPI0022E7AA2C|nr:helix-turn-helix transcriptional regulator [Eggerthella sinensis]
MSFRDNLQHVRSTHDLSQAQLAALLGVSRQSVAKWEAERSYPEMDKLIKLCDLFACSLDDLVRGNLTQDVSPIAEAIEVEAEVADGPAAVEVADACGYDEHMRRRAWDIAAGVAAIVMSFGVNFFIVGGYGSMAAGVSIVIHLIGVAVSLCFFVPAYRSHAAFREEHPVVEDFYAPQEKAGARRRKTRGIVAAVALVVLGFYTPGMLATFHIYNQFPSLALFTCFAAAAALFVYSVMMDRRVDVSFYNGAPDFTIQSLLRGRRTGA